MINGKILLSVNDKSDDLTKVTYGKRNFVYQDLDTQEDVEVELDDTAIDMSIGDYICWVRVEPMSNIYLDNFLLVDNDEIDGLEATNSGSSETGGFDLVANLWWIIVVICAVCALVVVVITKKKGTAAPAQEQTPETDETT